MKATRRVVVYSDFQRLDKGKHCIANCCDLNAILSCDIEEAVAGASGDNAIDSVSCQVFARGLNPLSMVFYAL